MKMPPSDVLETTPMLTFAGGFNGVGEYPFAVEAAGFAVGGGAGVAAGAAVGGAQLASSTARAVKAASPKRIICSTSQSPNRGYPARVCAGRDRQLDSQVLSRRMPVYHANAIAPTVTSARTGNPQSTIGARPSSGRGRRSTDRSTHHNSTPVLVTKKDRDRIDVTIVPRQPTRRCGLSAS